MNRYPVLFFCGAVFFSGLAGPARAAGSPRPEVRKNLERLMKSNSCPSCDLAGAVLTRIDLSGANLEGANLAGARLYLADLSDANLKNANLQGAGLGGADLANADLRGANLTGAVLEGAYLKGALMDGVVTTRHAPDEDGVTGAGRTVFIGDGSRPKRKPYTQDVVVERRQDLAATPAEQAIGREKQAAVQEKGGYAMNERVMRPKADADRPGHTPKRLSPMADAVVPATVVPKRPAEDAAEVVELAAVAKEKVGAAAGDNGDVTLPEQPQPAAVVSATGSEGESAGPPAGDWQGHRAGTGELSATAGEGPVAEQVAAGQENGGEGEAGAAAAKSVGQGPAAGKTAVREAVASIPAAAATVAASPPASDRRKLLVERLLDGNQCPECDLQGVDLSGRRLGDADLERADLRRANLEDADLENANLKGADLRGANLRKANLRGADLYMANLGGADLTGARMEGTLVDSADFTGAVGVSMDQAAQEE